VSLVVDKYDQKVWEIIKVPRFEHPTERRPVYAGVPQKQAAYSVAEIAATLGRKEFMVTYSLKRLEKRGARDTHEGWLVPML
jgi:hypothetical protein